MNDKPTHLAVIDDLPNGWKVEAWYETEDMADAAANRLNATPSCATKGLVMSTQDKVKLKPCPCGAAGNFWFNDGLMQKCRVRCMNPQHDLQTPMCANRVEAAAKWNTRAYGDSSTVRLREALIAIRDHPHNSYDANASIENVDGHRCAANIARAALTGEEK